MGVDQGAHRLYCLRQGGKLRSPTLLQSYVFLFSRRLRLGLSSPSFSSRLLVSWLRVDWLFGVWSTSWYWLMKPLVTIPN
jgi:hypothetical protein